MGNTLSQLPSFFWNVLLHWQALVTGGIVTAIFAGYQGLTAKAVKAKTYFWIFIVAALVCSFFLAWHDEHENTARVIAEKAAFASLAGSCSSNMSAISATLRGKEELANSLQATLTNLQAPQLQQQATINSCVVSLGKMNPIINTRTGVVISAATSTAPPAFKLGTPSVKYFLAVVISINRRTPFTGTIKCLHPFKIESPPQITLRESNSGCLEQGRSPRYPIQNMV